MNNFLINNPKLILNSLSTEKRKPEIKGLRKNEEERIERTH